jgi:hypothetical protein
MKCHTLIPCLVAAAGLAIAPGCKKKETAASAPAAGSAANGGNGGNAAGVGSPGSAGAAPVTTAAGGAVTDLPVVADCPKSLGGSEKVARTIKKACGPIVVTSNYVIAGTLTLEAGVVLKFQPGTDLEVGYGAPGAKLVIQGGDAPDQRVVFTTAGDQAAGVWKGVWLYDGAARSSITGLDVAYAGEDGNAAFTIKDAPDVTFTKSTIKHAKDVGLTALGKSTFAAFTANTFDDIGKIALAVEPTTVGTLAPGNTFGKDAFIQVAGGKLERDATWKNVGAPYHVIDEVNVNTASTPTTLTLTDVTLVFPNNSEVAIGYGGKGKLIVTGPAVFTSADGKPGSWKGVRIYDTGDATIDNATFIGGGSDDGTGALMVKGGGKLALGTATFKDNKVGLWADPGATVLAPKPLTFSGNTTAAHLAPPAFGGLSGANVYDDGAVIEVSGGKLTADTTWALQPKAKVAVLEELQINDGHTLTIAAGTNLAFKSGIELAVGYGGVGTLKAIGKADAPITVGALDKDAPWNGIKLYDQARAVELTNVTISGVGDGFGVTAKSGSVGKLDHVSCAACAATIAPECGAKVDTATAVTAGAGTKLAIKKPDGC